MQKKFIVIVSGLMLVLFLGSGCCRLCRHHKKDKPAATCPKTGAGQTEVK